jgi:hypothetical protein
MDLWRAGEYPVDKSVPRAPDGVSKGFQEIACGRREAVPIKNYDQVKNFIKKMYRRSRASLGTVTPP